MLNDAKPEVCAHQIITHPGQMLSPTEIAEIAKRELMPEERTILVEEYHCRELTDGDRSFLSDYPSMPIWKKAKFLGIPDKRLKELLKR